MTDDSNSPKTMRWERCPWVCPICGLEGNSGLPAHLQLVDTSNPDIDEDEAWMPYDADLYQDAYPVNPVVYCQNCETVFDVDFEPREGESDE